MVKKFENMFTILTQYTNVRDTRQTDITRRHRLRICIASRDKKTEYGSDQ